MQEKLIIFLQDDPSRLGWAVMDKQGNVRQSMDHDTPLGLAEIADNKEVIVIVPAQSVLLTSVQLPKLSRSRLRQAVPFALEETLTENIEQLHFALGPLREGDADMPVAVVSHEKMRAWLALLQSWTIKPSALVSAVFALPLATASTWHAAIGEAAWLRSGTFSGFGCEKANFLFLLGVACSHTKPIEILIKNYELSAQPLALTIPDVSIQESPAPPEQMMHDFARVVAHTPFINLLQQSYSGKKSAWSTQSIMKKVAVYGAAAWLTLLFLYPLISYLILEQRAAYLQTGIKEIYKRHFPRVSHVSAPRQHMEEQLKHLSSGIKDLHFFLLLSALSAGLHAEPGVKLQRFDFQNNQLTLHLIAVSSEAFSAFTDFLSQQGRTVKQQSANLSGSKIDAVISLE